MSKIAKGTHVKFREGTKQYAASMGIVYVVDEDPRPVPDTDPDPDFKGVREMRMVVSLTRVEDVARPYSRQRGRMAWLEALEEA